MPETSGQVADTKAATVAVTSTPEATVASTPTQTEPVGTVVTKVIDGLTTLGEARNINAELSKLIPRDSKGKALASAHDGILDTTSEPEPGPTPTPEPAPVVEPEPTPEPEPEPTVIDPTLIPDPEPEPEPTDGKLPQHRVRARDSFDDQVMRRYNNAIRDGTPISMEACVAAEKAAQGILAPPAPKPTDAPVVKGLDVAQRELAELREKRKTARAAFDEVGIEDATTAIEDKLQEIADLKEDGRARQQSEAHKRQTAWQANESQAVSLYPQVIPDPVKGLSADGKRLIAAKDRLFDEHKNSNDPIRFRVDYPLLLLKLAAAEEGIAPSTVKKTITPPAKIVPTRSVTPAKPAPPLASASARTTQTGTAPTTVAAYLDKGITLRESKDINKELRKLVRR